MPRPRQFDTETALDQAVAAFWERGYDNASIQDLCDAMGIRPASLYGAFGDKRALFLQALEAYMLRSFAGFADALEGARGARGLELFFDRLVTRLSGADSGHWGCLVTNSAAELARRDAAVADLVEGHWGRLEAILAERLVEAQALDELRPGVGPQAARLLICIAQGLNVMAKTRPGQEALALVARTALDGLIQPRGSAEAAADLH